MLPILFLIAATSVPMETTELPAKTTDGAAYNCQLQTRAGWITPGELRATDKVTGRVLLDIPAGAVIRETKCINAPDGHALVVLHPAFGSQFQKAE